MEKTCRTTYAVYHAGLTVQTQIQRTDRAKKTHGHTSISRPSTNLIGCCSACAANDASAKVTKPEKRHNGEFIHTQNHQFMFYVHAVYLY
jgi:hypothetical protein